MKGGAAAFLLVLAVLSKHIADLPGRITLCLVGDEESLGPLGSRFLLDNAPEVVGDVLLSTEPSSTGLIRYGEKGIVVGKAVFRGEAGHAAYPQAEPNCIVRAAAFINELSEVVRQFDGAAINVLDPEIDGLIGEGASAALGRNVLNVGHISGGVRHNMIPRACVVDVDVRTPVGIDARGVADAIRRCAESHHGEYLEHETTSANVSDKDHALFGALVNAVEIVTGRKPMMSLSLGVTDCRLWRSLGIPAAVYGLHPGSMAADTEYLEVDDLVTIAQVHALACVQLLRDGIRG
jgi:succinyl-diaminopimelate desuccinylase